MKELIFSVTKKDLVVQTFKSGGKGGQHQNTTDSGVRIVHKQSGAIGESRTERSQLHNKKLALRRLADSKKFKMWAKMKAHEIFSGKSIEQYIQEAIKPENLKIETKDSNGNWGIASPKGGW